MALFDRKQSIGAMIFGIVFWGFLISVYTLFRIYAIPLIPDEIFDTIKIRLLFIDIAFDVIDIIIYGYLVFKVIDSIFDGFINSIINLAIVVLGMFIVFANFNYIGFPFGVMTISVDLDFLQVQIQISLLAIFLPLLIVYGIFFARDLIIYISEKKIPNDCVDMVWGGSKDNFDDLADFRMAVLGEKEEVTIAPEEDIMPKM